MTNIEEVMKYSKRLNVLYVEDDKALREDTYELLEDYFDCLDCAVDGKDGLDKYIDYAQMNKVEYDLVITDLNMPNLSGLELIQEIYKINADQQIVVISAHGETDRLIEMIEADISGFILKPIVLDKVLSTILKVSKSISNKNNNDKFLAQQSRNASMGEMIDSIAHQWMQPITILNGQVGILTKKNEKGILTKDDIASFSKKQESQIIHMVDTLKEFRNFFRSEGDDQLDLTNYTEIIKSVLVLLNEDVIANMIKINIKESSDYKSIKINANSFKHVLIIVIKNMIDAFNEKQSDDRQISIETLYTEKYAIMNMFDNAGGIPSDIIDKIFNHNFTTKSSSGGTGVGLALAVQIINKVGGSIKAENIEGGAKFVISVPIA